MSFDHAFATTQSVTELLAAGIAHQSAGRLDAAAASYAAARAADPSNAQAAKWLGIIALARGDLATARTELTLALRLDPDDASAHTALANVDEANDALHRAMAGYRAALALDPGVDAAVAGFVRVALRAGDPGEARAVAEAAVARGSRDAAVLRALGAARLAAYDWAAALDACYAALESLPHADAFANAASALAHLQQDEAAVAACRRALELEPNHADTWNTLGIAHKGRGEHDAALAAYDRALALGHGAARQNRGALLMALGEVRAGWRDLAAPTLERRANRIASSPLWDGGELAGRRITVWPEQGIGDALQFCRYVPWVAARGGRVTLGCRRGTRRLLQTLAGVEHLVDMDSPFGPGPADAWVPLTMLPQLATDAGAAIASEPYLHADPAAREQVAAALAGGSARRRIGIVWSGNPRFAWNDIRSCGIASFDALQDLHDVTFVALQAGAARADAARSRLPLVVPGADEIRDFADTAAFIAALDLVITVDTSVAHLAGALGAPCWVLLCNRPDWRWGDRGDATPWYPSLRLFRQPHARAWEAVFAEVRAELATL